MKICFVLEHYFPHIGGAETFFKNLAERLVKNGHQCFVVTSRLSMTKKYEKLNGVEVHRVSLPAFLRRYIFTFLSIPAVYKISRGCDAIHTTTYNGAFPAFFVSRLLKKPAVITIHELGLNFWKTLSGLNWFSARLHLLMEKIIIALPFDRYICVSYYTRNYVRLRGVDDRKMLVINSGVDYDLFSYQKEGAYFIREKLGLKDNFVYLYFGRPGFFKGVEFLVRAVPLISEKIPKAKLVLIISKEPRGKYKRILSIIKELKLKDSLIILDSVGEEELIKYISSCDCVVLPSLTEGFGFSCVEACSVGRPVVTADVGAIPEVISGEYVFITPQSPEEICRGVKSVYLGKTQSLPPKKFYWNDCVSKYEEVYNNILK